MNLASHIQAHGNWMPWAEVMELALYDEAQGYYSTHVQDIGFRGDFSTSATMSDLPARRLVAHWKEACHATGRHLPFIEIGGGNGNMALAVARELGFLGRLRTRYHMVDRSPALRSLQALAGGHFVRVHSTIEAALRSAGGRAFIFSNELPDAFPARLFCYRAGAWQELGLSVQDGHIVELARPCPALPESSAFARWAQEGQVIEVHESYHHWYTQWQPLWKCGVFVTIDYGAPCESLYYRRPAGTLRGYKAHIMLSKQEMIPLAGRCDMTADVNFTDLQTLARRIPGDVVQLLTQREYLLPCVDAQNPADLHLTAEPGAGDHFRVLVQYRFDEA